MSSDIFYHETIVRIPASHGLTAEDLFLHLSQCGSNNCYEYGRNGGPGRRSRSWQANAFGTEKQVLSLGIKLAGDTEGGMLKIGGATRWVKAESYIRRVRNLLKDAKSTNALLGHTYAGQRVGFSAFYRDYSTDAKSDDVPYDYRDPTAFREFHGRYNACEGFNKMAFHYFKVYGPEMR
ncbi:MAG: hypothetical protein V4448_16305 [Pseudomonadota bacterium]